MPKKYQQTPDEELKTIKNRFKDSRTHSDFIYIMTTKKHDSKSIRENSHSLQNVIVKTYPTMRDKEIMQILKQKFLTSINLSDLEKSILNDKLAIASHQEIVDSMAKAEEFRKTKVMGRDKTGDDWFIKQIQTE